MRKSNSPRSGGDNLYGGKTPSDSDNDLKLKGRSCYASLLLSDIRDVIPLPMVYHFLLRVTTLIVDVSASIRLAPDEKDLQIGLLRQQLHALERKIKKKPRLSRPEKLMLVALTTRLQRQTQRWQHRLHDVVLLDQPETVLKWHRELVVGNGLIGDQTTEDGQS